MAKLTVAELKERIANNDKSINEESAYEAALELYHIDANTVACAILGKLAKKQDHKKELTAALTIDELKRNLASPIPGIRKTTAVLMGNIGASEYSRPIIEALKREEYRYVRPSMLLALGAIGDTAAVAFVQSYRVEEPKDETEVKHAEAEKEAVRLVLGRTVHGVHAHFSGLSKPHSVELRCANMLGGQLAEELSDIGIEPIREFSNGVLVETNDMQSLFEARCFSDALFPIRRDVSLNAAAIGGSARKFLFELMDSSTDARPPYRYRIDMPNTVTNKAALASEIASVLDSPELLNSPSFYDIELKIEIIGAPDRCALYAKLCCVKDNRFNYRKEMLPASIAPSTAAAVLRLASDELHSRARVLDPFCGTGTMLIERSKLSPCGALTGVDITPKAIDKAKVNAAAADVDIELICKDCIKFRASEPYDEVIANMPFGLRVGSHEINDRLYAQFLKKLPEWLKPGGIALLYTMEYTLLKRLIAEQNEMELLSRKRTEAGGLLPTVFLLRRK